jgi:putative DNA primase/helicase
MSSILKSALKYQEKGFSVIPLKSKGKEALVGWKTYQKNKPTAARIKSWWKDSPRANVGIVTGKLSGIIVIDCDSNGACKRFVEAHPEARATLQVKTGKGKHYYFEWATGIRNNTGSLLGPGIDVRGEGGYVAAPPSIHENGKHYKWVNENSIQPLPKKLKDVLTSSSKKRATSQPRSSTQFIKEGERNARLTSIAGAMQRQGMHREAMLAALLSENNSRCDPPLADSELEQIVKSVCQYPVAANTEELTDAGNARRFAAQHRDEVRYCHKWKSWLIWDGRRWRRDEDGAVIRKAKETAKRIYSETTAAPDEESRKKLSKHAMRSESALSIRHMVFLAQSERGIATHPSELDSDIWLLNVKNGTLDLKSGRLEPHKKEHLITKLAPVTYSSSAKCPQWGRFLRQIMDCNDELIEFLQRAIGWSLTGDVREQKLFFLFGKGANGKSTFLNIIREMLGDYAKQAAPELLLKKFGNTHPTEIADLQGARFVVAVEIDEGRHFAQALVKQLTGGDNIKARRLYQDLEEFTPTHKLFVAANYKPIVGDDDAMFRRLCVVPFTVSIPEQKQDKDLLNKLRTELPGILAWAVRGCLDWQKGGLQPPAAVVNATDSYRAEMDVIERFLSEQCTLGAKHRVRISTLFDVFTEWCERNGENLRLNSRAFSARLQNREFTTKHTNKGDVWIGISLNDEEDVAA